MNVIRLKNSRRHFFSLKTNKSSGYEGNNFSVNKICLGLLIKKQLMHIFNSSLAAAIFPDDFKITRLPPIFIAGDDKKLEN